MYFNEQTLFYPYLRCMDEPHLYLLLNVNNVQQEERSAQRVQTCTRYLTFLGQTCSLEALQQVIDFAETLK